MTAGSCRRNPLDLRDNIIIGFSTFQFLISFFLPGGIKIRMYFGRASDLIVPPTVCVCVGGWGVVKRGKRSRSVSQAESVTAKEGGRSEPEG